MRRLCKGPCLLVCAAICGAQASAEGGQFVQPVITGTTASGLSWSAVATGTALPYSTLGTVVPGAVVYFNIFNGQIQLDTHGLAVSSFVLTYTSGSTNVTASTPGPFQYPTGTGANAYSPVSETPRTFPARSSGSGGLDPTTYAARLGLVVGAPLGSSLNVGTNPNSASTSGFLDLKWAFPSDLVISGSLSTMDFTNFRTIGQSSNLNANVLGYGSQQSVFHYRVNGIMGGPVGAVIPVGPGISIASGVQTQEQAGCPMLFGSIPVVKMGEGTLVLDQANTLSGSTTVQGGRLRLAHEAALTASLIVPLAGGTVTLSPGLVTAVGGLAANAGGITDVGSGRMTIKAGLSSLHVQRAIDDGRSDGSWLGKSGITSSQAAADVAAGVSRTVGWLTAGDGSMTVAYAAPGDANLDWIVDVLDASKFVSAGKYGTGMSATWVEGDFNYDGVVDIQDLSDFANAGLYGAGTYNAFASIAAVPEPSAFATALVGVGVAGFRMCRRRPAV